MADYTLFRKKAPLIMSHLIADFGLNVDQAAAIVGNLGHESGGFRFLQEIKPLVPGSRGGWGWAQWTGPRRKQFEAWVADRGFDPRSDEANYGFLKFELENTETDAIPAVRASRNLEEAVKRFEQKFERAHKDHKNYPSRERYAEIARAEYLRFPNEPPDRPWSSDNPDATREGMLVFGMSGPQVLALQESLIKLDYPVGKRDGIFGSITRSMVLAFQADNGLDTTGEVDKETWETLAKAPPRPLSRERTTMTAAELAALGSRTIRDGNRTKMLGWVAGILGLLGISTDAARSPGTGLFAPPSLPPSTQAILDRLYGELNTLGGGTGPVVTRAKAQILELERILAQNSSGLTVDNTSPVGQGINALLGVASGILPGVPGGVLAIGVGVLAHVFGNRVVKARLEDHHDSSNTGH